MIEPNEVWTGDGEYVGRVEFLELPPCVRAIPEHRRGETGPARRMLAERRFNTLDEARDYLLDEGNTPPLRVRMVNFGRDV